MSNRLEGYPLGSWYAKEEATAVAIEIQDIYDSARNTPEPTRKAYVDQLTKLLKRYTCQIFNQDLREGSGSLDYDYEPLKEDQIRSDAATIIFTSDVMFEVCSFQIHSPERY